VSDDPTSLADNARRAAEAIRRATALVVAAGAGMGVDSGLPDFRGTEGFWNAYPPYRRLGIRFDQMANPESFAKDPAVGWGFYGHRMNLYRQTTPHAGFAILRRWAGNMRDGWFVFTSNVDGHFQRAGFDPDRVLECHGSIHHLQCELPCDQDVWSADGVTVNIDETTMRAAEPLPRCRRCGGLARPNILMFNDGWWVDDRTSTQQARYEDWLRSFDPIGLVVVELGAGSAIPTVRWHSEQLQSQGATIVRVNPREPDGPSGTISIASGGLAALEAIDAQVQ
jgi:NAD-dependent SIR2 family protein deacetylase